MTVSGPSAPGVAGAGASPKGSGCTRAMDLPALHGAELRHRRRPQDARRAADQQEEDDHADEHQDPRARDRELGHVAPGHRLEHRHAVGQRPHPEPERDLAQQAAVGEPRGPRGELRARELDDQQQHREREAGEGDGGAREGGEQLGRRRRGEVQRSDAGRRVVELDQGHRERPARDPADEWDDPQAVGHPMAHPEPRHRGRSYGCPRPTHRPVSSGRGDAPSDRRP